MMNVILGLVIISTSLILIIKFQKKKKLIKYDYIQLVILIITSSFSSGLAIQSFSIESKLDRKIKLISIVQKEAESTSSLDDLGRLELFVTKINIIPVENTPTDFREAFN